MLSLEEIRGLELKKGTPAGPESFCTIIDVNGLWEGIFSLYSIRLFHDQPIYVICDKETEQMIKSFGFKDVYCKSSVNEESNSKISKGIFNGGSKSYKKEWHYFHPIELMFRKPDAVDFALSENGNTLMVDGDIYYVKPIDVFIDTEVALYPQCANYFLKTNDEWREKMEARYGVYTGSMVYTSCKDFSDWWRLETVKSSVYYEQECLSRASDAYDVGHFPMTEQVLSYHFQGYGDMSDFLDVPCEDVLDHTGWKIDNGLHIQSGEVTSFHFHLDLGGVKARGQSIDYNAKILGRIFLTMLSESENDKHQEMIKFYANKIRRWIKPNPVEDERIAVNA